MDSDGHPLIVSGLNSEPKHAEHVIDYVRAVQRYANDNRISLRIAIHTGTADIGERFDKIGRVWQYLTHVDTYTDTVWQKNISVAAEGEILGRFQKARTAMKWNFPNPHKSLKSTKKQKEIAKASTILMSNLPRLFVSIKGPRLEKKT